MKKRNEVIQVKRRGIVTRSHSCLLAAAILNAPHLAAQDMPSPPPSVDAAMAMEPGQEADGDGSIAKKTPLVQDEFNQGGPLTEEFRDVAGELRCPTCTGLSVLESEAKFSVQIKDIVKEKVKAGESKEQILNYFTQRYGPWILRSPPSSGFNILAWAFPIGLLLSGPPLVWLFVWRKRRVVSTFGVRPTDSIVLEMEKRLASARKTVKA